MKLFTQESKKKTRFYVEFGPMAQVKVGERAVDKSQNTLDVYLSNYASPTETSHFKAFDVTLFGTFGVEYPFSKTNRFFVGLGYFVGLIDVASHDDLYQKNDFFSIELGIKF